MKPIGALLRDAVDRMTIYLPVIVTALLALGTYWLVRNAPKLMEPTAKEAPTHEPDFFMRNFVIKNFLPTGALRSELSGNEGRHYPDNDTLEVDQVRWRSISPVGLVTRGSANRGVSNGDGSEIQLFGDAVVIRDAAKTADGTVLPRLEFRGEFLHAFLNTERVRSHLPVVVTSNGREFRAAGMDYDHLSGQLQLQGKMRALLQPSAGASRR